MDDGARFSSVLNYRVSGMEQTRRKSAREGSGGVLMVLGSLRGGLLAPHDATSFPLC